MDRIRVGISSCLLGEAVRYDGGHRRDRFLADVLGGHVEWVPVCPEVEAGLGLPRPPMRLERAGNAVRMVEIESRRDHTQRMQRFAARRVRALRSLDLCGYVLKQGSPSCGMARVALHGAKGPPARRGTGLFARILLESMPDLPVEEEGRLQDPTLRENFIERIFAYQRLRALFARPVSSARIADFHAAHELQLMAHSPRACASLGRWVADVGRVPPAAFRERYRREFMAALARVASRGRNADVLRRAVRRLGPVVDATARAELFERIDDYRSGRVPLLVPITLLRQHARVRRVGSLAGQTFLEPHPAELMLRNHV